MHLIEKETKVWSLHYPPCEMLIKNLPMMPSKPSKNLPERFPEPSKIDVQSKKSIPQSVTWPSWLLTLPQLHFNVILNRNFCDFPPKIIPKWIKNQSKIHLSCLSSCNFIHTTRKLIFALPSKWNAHFYFLRGYEDPYKIVPKASKNPLRKL